MIYKTQELRLDEESENNSDNGQFVKKKNSKDANHTKKAK